MADNLPIVWQTENAGVPALYNGGLPAEFNTKNATKIKGLWINKKIKTVAKLKDYYKYKKNDMVVFRITPHAGVTNNNKRLWKAIYKMYEMYEGKGSRIERDRFKFTFREKDYFWFDVVFRQVNGQKKVEFYVSTSEYQATKLKRKLENKMKVTIEKADIKDIEIPKDNTIIQELKYLKHDIFSLNTNTNDNQTPISSIMNTLDELQHDGDFARLSICNEAENRQKWIKNAQWAMEKLKGGKVPQRANLNSKKITAFTKASLSNVVNEVNELLIDTFQAITNVFFKSDKPLKKEKIMPKGYSLEDEINATRLSNASYEKINLPVFKNRTRIAAHSHDKLTRETLAETLALATGEMSENNELNAIKINFNGRKYEIIEELNTLRLSNKTKYDPDVNLVSTDEMAKLGLQMPQKELQRKYADELSVKTRTQSEVPSAMQDKKGIWIGVAEYKDLSIDVYMPTTYADIFYRGYVFTGGQGAGKDTTIKRFVVEGNLKHNISFVVPDAIVEEGERGMADGIRDALPPERVIDIDLNDQNFVVPLDLTEVVKRLGRNGASRFADEMIDFLQIEGLSRSEKYLTDAAKASGGSLYNIKRIIEDEDFRLQRIKELEAEGHHRLANELIKWGDNEELGNKCDAIITRLNRFFGNERLFDIFAQDPLPQVDFAKWMKEGKVIIIRVPNGRALGENAVKTLVHWITLKTFMTRMLMNKEEQKNGCFMVFNEPEQYQSEGLTKLMGRIGTEGRKERLGSIYAFHHWDKLDKSLQKNLQGGGIQQFLFMNDYIKTFDDVKHRFEETIPLEDAYKLPEHHAIISVRTKGGMQPAFICHMAPPVEQKYNNSFLTKRHARMYGRAWEELQQAL